MRRRSANTTWTVAALVLAGWAMLSACNAISGTGALVYDRIPCQTSADCKAPAQVCEMNVCVASSESAPTCSDGQHNGSETDVDCGGGMCLPCADHLKCLVSSDCAGNVCVSTKCQTPTCMDGIQNQGETDVDCGGIHCAGCGNGDTCVGGSDCASSFCVGGMCCNQACAGAGKQCSAAGVCLGFLESDHVANPGSGFNQGSLPVDPKSQALPSGAYVTYLRIHSDADKVRGVSWMDSTGATYSQGDTNTDYDNTTFTFQPNETLSTCTLWSSAYGYGSFRAIQFTTSSNNSFTGGNTTSNGSNYGPVPLTLTNVSGKLLSSFYGTVNPDNFINEFGLWLWGPTP